MLFVSKRKSDISHSFKLDYFELMSDNCVKLLALNIGCKLKFSIHSSVICKKVRKCLDVEMKLLVLGSFILYGFNYCPIVWHFCSTNDIRKIKRMQE